MSDDYTSAPVGTGAGTVSSVQDGRDLTTWEKVKQGLEPARVAEVVRTVVLLLGLFGIVIPADQADLAISAVVQLAAGVFAVVAVVSWILTTFVRNRVTPVNKLDGGH